ncbi:hypothetical protein C2S52_006845 [Perilla frutescens var. hirtella]|nr:hypothetical protein C2S52_006845 [Perilla frutescens var. hirtella]
MILIVGLSSTSEIWNTLETNFASQSKAKLMQYKLQLQTLKKDNLSMRDYLSKVKSYCDLLGSAGHRVSDDDQILHILSGLGSEYDPAMVTITSKSDSWHIRNVHDLLLSFEARLESTRITSVNMDGSQPSANYVSQAPRNKTTNFGRGRGGFQRGFRGRGRSQGGHKFVCQVCDVPGHTADRCWHRFDSNYGNQVHQQQGQSQLSNFQQNFQQPALNMARLPSFHSPSESSYDKYNGGNRLQMGNGMGVDIAHIGTSSFKSPLHSRVFILNKLLHVPCITKNLLSVSQFARENNVYFEFHSRVCFMKDQVTNQILLQGTLKDGLYQFNLQKTKSSPNNSAASSSNSFDLKSTSFMSSLTASVDALQSTVWRAAMQDEFDALLRNKTWHLVDGASFFTKNKCPDIQSVSPYCRVERRAGLSPKGLARIILYFQSV